MATLPVIYTIQALDAPQHTDRLRKILQNLETENRIRSFTVLSMNDDLSTITNNLGEEDMVLIVLTRQLELNKKQIENHFSSLKANQPKAKVAEILVDNVVYDNEFITFPADLRPIRNNEDINDNAWSGIEESLKNIFSAREEQEGQTGNERLILVKKHPDYPKLLEFKPDSVYLYGRYVIQIIFGFLFTSIAIFFTATPPVSDSFFNQVWSIISIFFIVIGVGIAGFGIYRLVKLIFSNIKKLPAIILDKRVSVSGGGQTSATTTYYVTLEFEDRERREVKVRGKKYGKITNDDVGVAYIRDRYLLDYKRLEI